MRMGLKLGDEVQDVAEDETGTEVDAGVRSDAKGMTNHL